MSQGTVRLERNEAVALVTIDHVERQNALSEAMRDALAAAMEEADGDSTTRVIVLTGAGEQSFAAGGDIRELAQRTLADQRRVMENGSVFGAVRRVRKPVIAAVNGFCLGGGLELALACDLRIASDDAQLGLTEINLAIIPGGGGTQRLPRLVGRGKALEMILTGMRIPAAEALRIGLVERVVPVADLPSAAMALARTMAEKAPVALRYAKEAVVGGLGLPLDDGIRLENDLATLLRTTEDRVEGAKAFVEKRKPRWTGR